MINWLKENNDVCGKNRYKNMIKWLKENNDVCGKKRYKKKKKLPCQTRTHSSVCSSFQK